MPVAVAVGGVVGRDLDHRPVVVLGALGRLPGAHPLPHAGFHQSGGVLHGEAAAGGQGHHMVRADGHDVAGAALADPLAQVKAAVHLVAGDEPGADAAVAGALEQVTGQLRFCREHDVVGDSGQLAALLIGGPVRGQVQGPADHRVPGRGRDGEGDRDLAHRDPAKGSAVLAGCARAVAGGLGVPVSSTISTTSAGSWPAQRCPAAQSAAVSSIPWSLTRARDSRCCIRYGPG